MIKTYLCPDCKIPRESDDKIKIKICLRCFSKMEIKDGKKNS